MPSRIVVRALDARIYRLRRPDAGSAPQRMGPRVEPEGDVMWKSFWFFFEKERLAFTPPDWRP
jgi:hypothetical protein